MIFLILCDWYTYLVVFSEKLLLNTRDYYKRPGLAEDNEN